MAGFNPDAYLKKKAQEFDPDAYLKAKVQPEPQSSPGILSKVGDAALGALGYVGEKIDRYSGAPTRAAVGGLMAGENPFSKFGQQFGEDPRMAPTGEQLLDQSGAGQYIPDKGYDLSKFGKAAGLILSGGKMKMGDLGAAATKNVNPKAIAGMATEMALDPTNLIPGKALGAAGKGLVKSGGLGVGLEKASYRTALTGLGAKTKELRKLFNKNRIDEVGKFAVENGIVGPGSTVESALKKTEEILGATGPKIKQTYSMAQEAVNNPEFLKAIGDTHAKRLFETEFQPQMLAQDIIESTKKLQKGSAGGRAVVNKVTEIAQDLADIGPTADIEQMYNFRRSLDQLIDFDKGVRETTGAQKVLKDVRNKIKTTIDDRLLAIEQAAAANPQFKSVADTVAQLKENNRIYSLASDVADVGRSARSREAAKLPVGLFDVAAGGSIGGLSGGPNALATGLISSGMIGATRKYGAGIAAPAMRSAGQALQSTDLGAGMLKPGIIGSRAANVATKKDGKDGDLVRIGGEWYQKIGDKWERVDSER